MANSLWADCPLGCEAKCDCPSYYAAEGPRECFLKHTSKLLEGWELIRSKYLPSLSRLAITIGVGANEATSRADQAIKLALAFHDVGKLTQPYASGDRRNFRHELVGSWLLWSRLGSLLGWRPLARTAAQAVLLHHEPILMAQIAQAGERGLTLTDVWRRLEGEGERRRDSVQFLPKGREALVHILRQTSLEEEIIDVFTLLPDALPVSEGYKAIAQLVTEARASGTRLIKQKNRLFLGAVLSILVICDYRSAQSRQEEASQSPFWRMAMVEFGE